MIGSPNTINPTLEGIDINRMLRNVSPMMVRTRSMRPLATFSARVGKAAVETATFHLMDWLITEHRFTPTDAYCLVSTCPDFRINVYQMCKIGKLSFVAGAEIPKRYVSAT